MSNCHFREFHESGNGDLPSMSALGSEFFPGTNRLLLFVRGKGGHTSVDGHGGRVNRLYNNWGDALTCASSLDGGCIFGHVHQNGGSSNPLRVTVCRDCCRGILDATEKEESGLTYLQWAIIAAIIIAILLLAVILGCVFGLRN